MAVEDDKKRNNERKGFAGLTSLVSDVGTLARPAATKEPTTSPGVSPNSTPQAEQTAQPQPRQEEISPDTPQPSSESSGPILVIGIAAIIGVIWLIGQSSKTSTTLEPAYSPPAQSIAPIYSPPVQPKEPSRPNESQPPFGQNIVLSTPQIRYCLAEDIRMDGAKVVLNNYNEADIDRFNAMVADYNSRCGSFRYRGDTLESARRDIEPYRNDLQAEGSARFARPSSAELPTTPALPATPDATVQAVQQRLNELGYDVGSADGLMGRGTRSAIIAFQQDRGLAATGVADQALLLQLQPAPARSASGSTVQDPVVREAPPRSPTATPLPAPPLPSANSNGPPANSWVAGSNWYCKEGFRRVGNLCEAVIAPANAFISGSNWYCNSGFRKAGDKCVSVLQQ